MRKKPKQIDNRKHHKKSFNYLLVEFKRQKRKESKFMDCTVRDKNGKSVIRDLNEITRPLIFKEINYLLAGSHSLTDVDGQLEINGNLFIIESKSHHNSINGGQLVSLFHSVLNVWKNGKVGQLVYRIDTQDPTFYDYAVFGSEQFLQYLNNEPVVPHYEFDRPNSWLAERLRLFQELCWSRHDKEIEINNNRLFQAVPEIKKAIHNKKELVGF